MTVEIGRILFETGRAHGLSSDLLFRAALEDGHARGLNDPEAFAHNGPHSLSVHYLLGLGLELMLKAAICGCGGDGGDKALRKIGHDLQVALETATAAGFVSEAPRLDEIVAVINEPYKAHWFRYGQDRPPAFPLPGDFDQVVEMFSVLDDEIRALLGVAEIQT
jgi:hypothetical protein